MIKGYIYITTNKKFSVLYVGATKNLKNRIKRFIFGVIIKHLINKTPLSWCDAETSSA